MYFEQEKYNFQGNFQCFNQSNHSCNNSWRDLSNEILYQSSFYISLSNYVDWNTRWWINFELWFFLNIFLFLYFPFFFYFGKVRVQFLVFFSAQLLRTCLYSTPLSLHHSSALASHSSFAGGGDLLLLPNCMQHIIALLVLLQRPCLQDWPDRFGWFH